MPKSKTSFFLPLKMVINFFEVDSIRPKQYSQAKLQDFASNFSSQFEDEITQLTTQTYHTTPEESLDDDINKQNPNRSRSIIEAVSNAIDADSRQVNVSIEDGSYSVIDDGIGMDPTTLFRSFLVPKSSSKDDSQQTIGRFGLGFYTALAHLNSEHDQVIVETRREGYPGYRIVFRKINGEISITITEDSDLKTGTKLEVISSDIQVKIYKDALVKHVKFHKKTPVHVNNSQVNKCSSTRLKPVEQSYVSIKSDATTNQSVITIGGITIQVVNHDNSSNALHVVWDLPKETTLSESRDHVRIDSKSIRDQIKALIDHVWQLEENLRIPYLNTIAALVIQLQANNTSQEASENVVDYLREIAANCIGNRKHVPDLPVYAPLKIDGVLAVHPLLVSSSWQEHIGKKAPDWESRKQKVIIAPMCGDQFLVHDKKNDTVYLSPEVYDKAHESGQFWRLELATKYPPRSIEGQWLSQRNTPSEATKTVEYISRQEENKFHALYAKHPELYHFYGDDFLGGLSDDARATLLKAQTLNQVHPLKIGTNFFNRQLKVYYYKGRRYYLGCFDGYRGDFGGDAVLLDENLNPLHHQKFFALREKCNQLMHDGIWDVDVSLNDVTRCINSKYNDTKLFEKIALEIVDEEGVSVELKEEIKSEARPILRNLGEFFTVSFGKGYGFSGRTYLYHKNNNQFIKSFDGYVTVFSTDPTLLAVKAEDGTCKALYDVAKKRFLVEDVAHIEMQGEYIIVYGGTKEATREEDYRTGNYEDKLNFKNARFKVLNKKGEVLLELGSVPKSASSPLRSLDCQKSNGEFLISIRYADGKTNLIKESSAWSLASFSEHIHVGFPAIAYIDSSLTQKMLKYADPQKSPIQIDSYKKIGDVLAVTIRENGVNKCYLIESITGELVPLPASLTLAEIEHAKNKGSCFEIKRKNSEKKEFINKNGKSFTLPDDYYDYHRIDGVDYFVVRTDYVDIYRDEKGNEFTASSGKTFKKSYDEEWKEYYYEESDPKKTKYYQHRIPATKILDSEGNEIFSMRGGSVYSEPDGKYFIIAHRDYSLQGLGRFGCIPMAKIPMTYHMRLWLNTEKYEHAKETYSGYDYPWLLQNLPLISSKYYSAELIDSKCKLFLYSPSYLDVDTSSMKHACFFAPLSKEQLQSPDVIQNLSFLNEQSGLSVKDYGLRLQFIDLSPVVFRGLYPYMAMLNYVPNAKQANRYLRLINHIKHFSEEQQYSIISLLDLVYTIAGTYTTLDLAEKLENILDMYGITVCEALLKTFQDNIARLKTAKNTSELTEQFNIMSRRNGQLGYYIFLGQSDLLASPLETSFEMSLHDDLSMLDLVTAYRLDEQIVNRIGIPEGFIRAVQQKVSGTHKDLLVRKITHAIYHQADPDKALYLREFLQNALDAIGDGSAEKKSTIPLMIYQDGSNACVLSLQDSGVGMSLEQVFKYLLIPGASTKRDAKQGEFIGGRGVGLFTAYHGAKQIRLKTSTGNGTTHYFNLTPKYKTLEDGRLVIEDVIINWESKAEDFKGTLIERVSLTGDPILHAAKLHRAIKTHGRFVNADIVRITVNGEAVNQPMKSLATFTVPNLGVCHLLQSQENALTAGGLFVKDMPAEVLTWIPPMIREALTKKGLVINFPKNTQLNRERSDFEDVEAFTQHIKPYVINASLAAYLHLLVEETARFEELPYDFFNMFSEYIRQAHQVNQTLHDDAKKLNKYEAINDYAKYNNKKMLTDLLCYLNIIPYQESENARVEMVSIVYLAGEYKKGRLNYIDGVPKQIQALIRNDKESKGAEQKHTRVMQSFFTTREIALKEQKKYADKEWLPVQYNGAANWGAFMNLSEKIMHLFGRSDIKMGVTTRQGDALAYAYPRGTLVCWNVINAQNYVRMLTDSLIKNSYESFQQIFSKMMDTLSHEWVHLQESNCTGTHNKSFYERQRSILLKTLAKLSPDDVKNIFGELIGMAKDKELSSNNASAEDFLLMQLGNSSASHRMAAG